MSVNSLFMVNHTIYRTYSCSRLCCISGPDCMYKNFNSCNSCLCVCFIYRKCDSLLSEGFSRTDCGSSPCQHLHLHLILHYTHPDYTTLQFIRTVKCKLTFNLLQTFSIQHHLESNESVIFYCHMLLGGTLTLQYALWSYSCTKKNHMETVTEFIFVYLFIYLQ